MFHPGLLGGPAEPEWTREPYALEVGGRLWACATNRVVHVAVRATRPAPPLLENRKLVAQVIIDHLCEAEPAGAVARVADLRAWVGVPTSREVAEQEREIERLHPVELRPRTFSDEMSGWLGRAVINRGQLALALTAALGDEVRVTASPDRLQPVLLGNRDFRAAIAQIRGVAPSSSFPLTGRS